MGLFTTALAVGAGAAVGLAAKKIKKDDKKEAPKPESAPELPDPKKVEDEERRKILRKRSQSTKTVLNQPLGIAGEPQTLQNKLGSGS